MKNKWHNYFMSIAEESANLSKDPKTKVGAVIVRNRRIKSTGFNGAPQTFPDDLVPWEPTESTRLIDQKNTFMCHAELNAVLNYDGKVSDLRDADVYVTVSPCSRCACMLAQIKPKRVIYKTKYHRENETEAAEYIFKTCGIEYVAFDDLEEDDV